MKFVCNAWEIPEHTKPNTVGEIYSRHFFEHLTYEQTFVTLKAWSKVLIPGGLLEMIVPDMDWHVQEWLDGDYEAARGGFWGWQREGMTENWDVHKMGYNHEYLKLILETENFTDVVRKPTDDTVWRSDNHPRHLWITCYNAR
ncbi:MAG: hypothetical protein QGH83_00135 [Candidatus Pacebacteria bacterium]|nr:hypothetical protein [Candidatus Paceibacterota bacterium]